MAFTTYCGWVAIVLVSGSIVVEAPIGEGFEESVTDPYLCFLGVHDTASAKDLERSFRPLLFDSLIVASKFPCYKYYSYNSGYFLIVSVCLTGLSQKLINVNHNAGHNRHCRWTFIPVYAKLG